MPRTKKKTRKSKGRKKGTTARRGRPPAGTPSKSDRIRALLQTGMAPMDIAKKVGATPGLVYVVKSKMGGGGEAGKRRGPGRPRKTAAGGTDDLAGIFDAVRRTEREQAQLRAALEKIQAVIQAALS